MKRILLIMVLFAGTPDASDFGVEFQVLPGPSQRDASRIGVNLGIWTSWGAEQLSANVLKNPGFEGLIDRAIVITGEPVEGGFQDDTAWLARPAGFWTGGTFEVLSGPLRGRTGEIRASRTVSGRTVFDTVEPVTGVGVGEAVSVTKVDDGGMPAQWWLNTATATADAGTVRPGSPGGRSLRLTPREGGASAYSYLDAIGDRAGKLLPLQGEWEFSIWAKGTGTGSRLRVRLHRGEARAVLDETVSLQAEWRELRWRFTARDEGPAGTIELALEAADGSGPVWLDDASLRATGDAGMAFRRQAVETLRTLRPGYLRDWQGQLGDTLENRLAPAFARRTARYRPGGYESTEYFYGLPEFLSLAEEVGAQPWVVLPTTLSEQEWRAAGRFLAAEAARRNFREVIVEFGNENWNAGFRPAGIPRTATLAEAATRAFAALSEGAGRDSRIHTVLGGSFYNPTQIEALADAAPPGTWLGAAPYWAYTLNGVADFFPLEILPSLRALNARREVAIYEMNAHSLSSSLPAEESTGLLEGPASAAGLVWNLIGALEGGSRRICVYTLAGFDTYGAKPGELVRLFGITRDLAAANQFRPNGAALAAVNAAMEGDLHPVKTSSILVRLAALRTAGSWTLILASRSERAETVRVNLPGGGSVDVQVPAFGYAIARKRISNYER